MGLGWITWGNHFVSSSLTLTVLLCLSYQNNLLTNCYWSSCLIISFAPFKIFPDLVCYSTRISLELIMQTTETSCWVLPNSVTKTDDQLANTYLVCVRYHLFLLMSIVYARLLHYLTLPIVILLFWQGLSNFNKRHFHFTFFQKYLIKIFLMRRLKPVMNHPRNRGLHHPVLHQMIRERNRIDDPDLL